MAKRFFYVSAAMLCLALAYHLGAHNAVAQSGMVIVGSFDQDSDPCAAESGQLWILDKMTRQNKGPFPLPSSAPITSITADFVGDDFNASVLFENGDAYFHDLSIHSWYYIGNVLNLYPTGSARSSWGLVKARYR